MKLNDLLTEDADKLAAIYLKGVKQTDVLKAFKGSFVLSRGREDEIVSETVRLIKAGFISKTNLWNQFEYAKNSMKLSGDVNSAISALGQIKKMTGEHAPASAAQLYEVAIALQNLIEANNTLYGGIYKCKIVLDELAGLALKRYVKNTNPRDVDDQVSFTAAMTLKGLGIWPLYQAALADGKTL